MIYLRVILLTLIAGAGLGAQCQSGGMVVIVNKANVTESLSMAQLRKLILGDVRTWPDKQPVMLVGRDPSSDVAKCVLSAIVRMNAAEYQRYIMSTEFRGGDPPSVKTVNSGALAAKIIAAVGGSIAVVPASELPAMASTVRVIRVNGKEPGEAGYPL